MKAPLRLPPKWGEGKAASGSPEMGGEGKEL